MYPPVKTVTENASHWKPLSREESSENAVLLSALVDGCKKERFKNGDVKWSGQSGPHAR